VSFLALSLGLSALGGNGDGGLGCCGQWVCCCWGGINDVDSKECGVTEVGIFESSWLTSSSLSESSALECLLVVDLDLDLGLF